MAVKNVIFDIGGVLLEWNPMKLLTSMFDVKRAEILKANMMDSTYWAELDRGTFSINQAVTLFSQKIPELTEEIRYVLTAMINYLPVIQENVNILYELSKANYRLFVLSNFQREGFSEAYRKHDFFKLFDGLVISSHEKMIKPEKQIYDLILNRYSLVPSETVFFDDSFENINKANQMHIIGVHTPTPSQLNDYYLKELKRNK